MLLKQKKVYITCVCGISIKYSFLFFFLLLEFILYPYDANQAYAAHVECLTLLVGV